MVLERFRVDGQVAIVTGGGRGIGRASCLALGEAGAHVVLAARRVEVIESVAAEVRALGPKALAVPCDVNDPAQLDELITRTLETFHRIDILVNNAGGSPPRTALATTDEDFEAAFHFNVTTAFHLGRQAAPHLARHGGGSIINISSAMSHLVDAGFVAYGTAKAALNHMTRLLAHEWAPRIRVNAIAVGATVTDALEFVVVTEELRRQMEEMTPMRRLGQVEDIAAAVLYLASPASAWVTGKVLEVDGGTVATNWPYKIPSGLDG
jgi:7-alpha-hydroxysteroid dehydrogenase